MTNPEKIKVRADSEKGADSTKRYLRHSPISVDDRFLDLGANMCSVANWVAAKGCASVLAYEPFPLTLAQAVPVAAVRLVPKAITADGRDIVMSLAKAAIERNYTCSAHVARSNRKDAVFVANIKSDKIEDVLREFQPTYGKIDIEGGEYEVIPAGDFSGMHTLFVEFHGCNSPTQTVLMTMSSIRFRYFSGSDPFSRYFLKARTSTKSRALVIT